MRVPIHKNGKKTGKETAAERKQALLEHILELRKVIVISCVSVFAAFVLIFYFTIDWLMAQITDPISNRGIEIIYTTMSEALLTKLKVALVAAVIAASPIIVWQIWRFIKPALYPKEKRVFRPLFFTALVLFLTGIIFCYGAVYFLAVDFFLVAGENLAKPMLSIDKYVGFLFGFLLPFGLAFQLPVCMYITTRAGWTNAKSLSGKRKYVLLALAVLAAVLTPPDVLSQLMLLIPMYLLFETGVLVSKTVKPGERN